MDNSNPINTNTLETPTPTHTLNKPINTILDSIKKQHIKKLVLSGGGLLGISYIGLLKYLEEHNINKQITQITGCSAGAIFGTFIAIGYTSIELQKIMKTLNFKDYINITAESILNFMKLKGLDSGKNIMLFIKQTIKDKTNDENITFLQIFEKYKINLKMGVTNLTSSSFEILDMYSTPNLPIYQAINASIAIPFIYEPVIINKCVYCDGGILDNLPLEHLLIIDDSIGVDVGVGVVNSIDVDITKSTESESTPTTNTNTTKTTTTTTNINNINTTTTTTNINNNNNNTRIKDTLGIYLLNKFNILNNDNIQELSLSYYFNSLMHAFCKSYINNKKDLNDIRSHNTLIIIYEIPCDIMTFLKLSATHDDIDNIINIAYITTKNKLDTLFNV